ncbi:tRNA uridine(34) hydroxylas [Buchnera aphidicola (Sipha maydis)]|uniref:oxygen-dependent tRNA uridine(34) hydroxylase TrhO n=1 Tax=Buchnera aphidicola TaxID=9 RepID=UPI003464CC95
MSGIINFITNKKFINNSFKEYLRINFSFYRYFYIDEPLLFKNKLEKCFNELNIFGRIYISHEGINAQGDILKKFFNKMKYFISQLDPQLNNININIGIDNTSRSFSKLKIKIKKKIVSDGLKNNFFQKIYKKKYLHAKQVNKYLKKKNVIFFDIRNYYEYRIGHFKNSISTYTFTFRDQLKSLLNYINFYKNKKIVLYCTGGIRCEKAASLIYNKGYKKVYQIFGGIIGYINECKNNNIPIKFFGKNFVFDYRLREYISKKILSHCNQCLNKSDYYVNCMNSKCNLLFIQCISCSKKYKSFCSKKCFHIFHQSLL